MILIAIREGNVMKNSFILSGLVTWFIYTGQLYSHCQMPCGIYHDNMVYEQIDQYIETMVKGITVLSDNKFVTLHDKNEFVRWIMTKETESNKVAELIVTYFLQQKIKPDEPDTAKRVVLAHRLLFHIVGIKQNIDIKMVKNFQEDWDKFKLLFHVEGYVCKMEQIKLKEWEEARKRAQQKEEAEQKQGQNSSNDHDHDHVHDHDHDHSHEHSHSHSNWHSHDHNHAYHSH